MNKAKQFIQLCISALRKFRNLIRVLGYYTRKVLSFNFNGQVYLIGYTKKHPIYTTVFEDNPPEGYLFYYFNPGSDSNFLLKYLKKHSKLLHLDAASVDLIKEKDKKWVIECEGMTYHSFFNRRNVKQIFVESSWAGGEFLEEEKVKLLSPAIEINSKKKIRENNGGKSITLCAVGHGGMIKGFDVLVKLFYDLKKEHNLKLILAGSFGHNFEYYPEIKKEVYENAGFDELSNKLRNDSDVIFRIFKRKELFEKVYPQADIYVHLSRLETFGYSILEAMSFGLPVVASKLHAIPEMVVDNYNGFLIDSFEYDINSIEWHEKMLAQSKNAVIKLIETDGLIKRFGDNSINAIQNKFSIERKQQILKDCYKNTIAD